MVQRKFECPYWTSPLDPLSILQAQNVMIKPTGKLNFDSIQYWLTERTFECGAAASGSVVTHGVAGYANSDIQ